ncbi:MAG: OmpH family outer membrane protein [Brumimicrobium sp.]|nr:OmpH family outer membrane protein [Brumimicrobium sp.]
MKKLIAIMIITVFTTGVALSQTGMAHVNTQKILDTMPAYKSASKEFADFRRKAQEELQKAEKELTDDYNKYVAEAETMSPTARKFEETRLQKKQMELQQKEQELGTQMQQFQQDLMEPVYTKLQDAIKDVAKAQKISYVMEVSNLLYAEGTDITDLVIKKILSAGTDSAAGGK